MAEHDAVPEECLAYLNEAEWRVLLVKVFMSEIRVQALEDALDAITRQETMTPLLDPTAYRNGGGALLERLGKIARAFIAFKKALVEAGEPE